MKAILRYTGFSWLESLLGLAIIVLVVVVVLPAMKSSLRAEQQQRAEIQAREVAQAVLDYNADTGRWPYIHDGQVDLSVLMGNCQDPGRRPAGAALVGSFLPDIGTAVSDAEPWLGEEQLDPWRRPFRVFLIEAQEGGQDSPGARGVLVVSDGRNGRLETDPVRLKVQDDKEDRGPVPVISGDDIGFFLRQPDRAGMP